MKSWHKLRVASYFSVFLAGAVGPLTAVAQVAAPTQSVAAGGLEEIVVTAQRRAERLQDVPISVTAFTQEKMDAQGIRNVDDLTTLTPGVTFERMGLSAASNYNDENSDISIRGIDSSAGSSTTAIYIDDTPIQTRHIGFGTVNAFPTLFDLDRVEVLRGPQGTLFGASAEDGAIRFVTPDPNMHTYGSYLRSELSSTSGGAPSFEAGLAAGGPIINDTLGFRISAYHRVDGGYVDRADYRTRAITDPNANWQETSVLRAALKWAITDAVSVTPSIFYQRLQINDTGSYWPSLSNQAGGVFLNGNAQRSPSTDPFYLAAVKFDVDLSSSMHLTANASYFSRNQYDRPDYTQFDRAVFGLDPRAPYGDFGESNFADVQHNTILEARLQSTDPSARLTWTTGVYLAHLDENSTQFLYDPNLNAEYIAAYNTPFCGPIQCAGGQIYAGPENRVIDKQAALFGELTVKMGNGWTATGGVRIAQQEISGTSVNYGAFDGPTVYATNPNIASGNSTEHPVTPRFVLSYHPNGDNLIYASAAKGYRSGGINGVLPNTCNSSLQSLGLAAAPASFAADSLWSYEIGAKNTLLDRRLQVDASIFVVDWKGIQQNVYLISCGVQYTGNLGVARSQGGDIHVQARPFGKLFLDFTAAYTKARYTQTVCGGSLACTGVGALSQPLVTNGDVLPGAPWSFTFSTEYGLPMFSRGDPYVRLDYHYTTAQSGLQPGQDPNNGSVDSTIPGLPTTKALAMRAGLRWSGIDLSMFAQNLTNSHPLLFQSRDATNETLYFDRSTRPRTIGVTASYRY